MNPQPKIIQSLFFGFAFSTLVFVWVSSLLCSGESEKITLDDTMRHVLFAVGVLQLGLGNLGFSKLYNKNSALYKKLVGSHANKISQLYTSSLVLLAFTEAAAIVGLVHALSTSCKDSSYLILIFGALVTYLFWFPKEYKIKELIS
jgi:F0F1-type ATP synthase membrane subunit c/vacuolar-type H+-ATPase subunit K